VPRTTHIPVVNQPLLCIDVAEHRTHLFLMFRVLGQLSI